MHNKSLMSETIQTKPTIFQQIWNGEAPAHILYQNPRHQLMAMLGPKPVVEGHTLVVPEPAIEHWHDLPPELAAKAMLLGQMVARRMMEVLEPERATLHVMGYRVPHTHMKIIPSYAQGDTMPVYSTCPNPRPVVSADDLATTYERLAFPENFTSQVDAQLDKVAFVELSSRD